MATATVHVTVTSVAEKLFDDQAQSVTVPGVEGMLEILAHHEPFVSTLKAGTVTVHTQSGETQTFSITGGVVEVSNNHATVLL